MGIETRGKVIGVYLSSWTGKYSPSTSCRPSFGVLKVIELLSLSFVAVQQASSSWRKLSVVSLFKFISPSTKVDKAKAFKYYYVWILEISGSPIRQGQRRRQFRGRRSRSTSDFMGR